MSGLPPLQAATTLPPGTYSLSAGSLSCLVKAMQWEVSQPMMPMRSSAPRPAAVVASPTANTGRKGKFIGRNDRARRAGLVEVFAGIEFQAGQGRAIGLNEPGTE